MNPYSQPAVHGSAPAVLAVALTPGLFACGNSDSPTSPVAQMDFGYTTASPVRKDGLKFKDLNKNGQLEPYEDWRLSADARATWQAA